MKINRTNTILVAGGAAAVLCFAGAKLPRRPIGNEAGPTAMAQTQGVNESRGRAFQVLSSDDRSFLDDRLLCVWGRLQSPGTRTYRDTFDFIDTQDGSHITINAQPVSYEGSHRPTHGASPRPTINTVRKLGDNTIALTTEGRSLAFDSIPVSPAPYDGMNHVFVVDLSKCRVLAEVGLPPNSKMVFENGGWPCRAYAYTTDTSAELSGETKEAVLKQVLPSSSTASIAIPTRYRSVFDLRNSPVEVLGGEGAEKGTISLSVAGKSPESRFIVEIDLAQNKWASWEKLSAEIPDSLHGYISSLQFREKKQALLSPDNRQIAIEGRDGSIHVQEIPAL